MIHAEAHPLAGRTVRLNIKPSGNPRLDIELDGQEYEIEDYWDRLTNQSWTTMNGNPAVLKYSIRAGLSRLPADDEVVYGHTKNNLGHLVHVSELGEVLD